jgi:hypothetical protein
MGYAIIDSNNIYANSWSRWDNPPRPLLEGETVIECEWDEDNNQPVGVTMPTPIAIVPTEVTPAQIRVWLISQGVTMAQVDAFLDAIEDNTQREIAKAKWEYGIVVYRTDPLVVAFAQALGMTESQMDAAFIAASEIT